MNKLRIGEFADANTGQPSKKPQKQLSFHLRRAPDAGLSPFYPPRRFLQLDSLKGTKQSIAALLSLTGQAHGALKKKRNNGNVVNYKSRPRARKFLTASPLELAAFPFTVQIT